MRRWRRVRQLWLRRCERYVVRRRVQKSAATIRDRSALLWTARTSVGRTCPHADRAYRRGRPPARAPRSRSYRTRTHRLAAPGVRPTPTVHAQHAVRPHPSDNQCSTHTITSASSTGSRAPAYRYQSFMLCASARVARRGVGGRAAPADRPPAVVDISRGRHCRPRLRGRYRCAQAASEGGVFTAVPKRKKKKRRGRGGEEKEERVRQLSQRLYPATCHLLPSRARAPQPDRMQNCMKIGSESQNFPACGGRRLKAGEAKQRPSRAARAQQPRPRA